MDNKKLIIAGLTHSVCHWRTLVCSSE